MTLLPSDAWQAAQSPCARAAPFFASVAYALDNISIMGIRLETRGNRKRQTTILFLLITKKSPSIIPITHHPHKSVHKLSPMILWQWT